jgi:hypothetical protein
MNQARFAYAQTRLQARHGQRPGEAVWQRLASAGDFANYLAAARRTPLLPWIDGIQTAETSHALESRLRQQFRRYIDDVAHWLPIEWRASVQWIGQLPDLPALQFLLQTGTAPGWMHDEAGLSQFTSENKSALPETLLGSEHAYLGKAWQEGIPLYEAWFEQWQRLCPAKTGLRSGLTHIGRLVRQHLLDEQTTALPANDRLKALAVELNAAFRRNSFKPAAACAHLGLVALDLERLRGELVQRALFEENTAAQA